MRLRLRLVLLLMLPLLLVSGVYSVVRVQQEARARVADEHARASGMARTIQIAVENAHIFKKHGGANFAAIPCLNDSAPGMEVIRRLALRELQGWV